MGNWHYRCVFVNIKGSLPYSASTVAFVFFQKKKRKKKRQLKKSEIINSINHHIKQPFLNNHFGESNRRACMLLVGDYIQEKDGKKRKNGEKKKSKIIFVQKNKIYSYPIPP
jgi:hypothetical protein